MIPVVGLFIIITPVVGLFIVITACVWSVYYDN